MDAVRRWNVRRRSPSFRALRNAGPPTSWLVVAGILSLAAITLLFIAGIDDIALLLVLPFLAFVLASWLDRDGWRIRMALAEVAMQQRARWRWGSLPVDAYSAERWLSEHLEAPPEVRASVLT